MSYLMPFRVLTKTVAHRNMKYYITKSKPKDKVSNLHLVVCSCIDPLDINNNDMSSCLTNYDNIATIWV